MISTLHSSMKRITTNWSLLIASLVITSAANAAWPERPVTVIVPFAAGGIADVVARLTAEAIPMLVSQAAAQGR